MRYISKDGWLLILVALAGLYFPARAIVFFLFLGQRWADPSIRRRRQKAREERAAEEGGPQSVQRHGNTA